MNQRDQLGINAIRILSAQGVQKANSGHPGLPMGAAPIGYALYAKHMRYNPNNPDWVNRDRFVLSAGHGSMLLYSLLHLFGFGVTDEDLAQFRQFGSKTPGHPEYKHTPGVETTTGPLGQGIANAVGFAAAEAHLASVFNRDGFPVVDHYTYALCGDGCLMEGVSAEASSLAGTWKLGKLILFYDCNRITIEGDTDIAFREDVAARYEAYGWQVQCVEDGNNIDAIAVAVEKAKADARPSMIIVSSQIGYGCPERQGKASAHGEPLGAENLAAAKAFLQWPCTEDFAIPVELSALAKEAQERGAEAEKAWQATFDAYKAAHPDAAAQWKRAFEDKLPDLVNIEDLWSFEKGNATRNTSGELLGKLNGIVPNLMGGAADLAPSTKTYIKGNGDFSAEDYSGRNMHFGVREFGMAAIANGMALHGGLRLYVSTFFVFCDYMKHAMRMASLMELPVVYVLTHDSIGVGEDGATHQPIEHLAMLRSMPNMLVYRPADPKETTAAWIAALERKGPTAIILTRQNLPLYEKSGKAALRGGYVLSEGAKAVPDVILMASGSEVEQCMQAQQLLEKDGVASRVVSIPSFEVFNAQDASYRESVLPDSVRARVAVEAASPFGWHQYVGLDGEIIAMNGFGASAPAPLLFTHFGFTAQRVAEAAKRVVKK